MNKRHSFKDGKLLLNQTYHKDLIDALLKVHKKYIGTDFVEDNLFMIETEVRELLLKYGIDDIEVEVSPDSNIPGKALLLYAEKKGLA